MKSQAFDKFAGTTAVVTGISGFVYSFAFVVLVVMEKSPELGGLLASATLTLGGILSTAVLLALYQRLRDTDAMFALWALALGMAGALGSAAHGAYDLGNAFNPPDKNVLAIANLPSQVDSRGFATFALAGIALVVVAWLLGRSRTFPSNLAYLTYASGAVSLVLYFGRLILLNPTNPVILIAALLEGFIINPIWYIWVGLVLRRGK